MKRNTVISNSLGSPPLYSVNIPGLFQSAGEERLRKSLFELLIIPTSKLCVGSLTCYTIYLHFGFLNLNLSLSVINTFLLESHERNYLLTANAEKSYYHIFIKLKQTNSGVEG